MANPQLNAADPVLSALLEQLEANTPPAPPGFWPPAPLYWLGFILLVSALAGAIWWWRRGRTRRRFLAALTWLQQEPEGARQLQQLHILLRNAARYDSVAHKTDSAPEFAQLIQSTLALSETPGWVNAHYRPDAGVRVDWREPRLLIKRWCS